MKKCTDTKHFSRWPFIAEEVREDGERNNGGINLITNPEQIEAIHEATDENGLRPIIIQLNAPNSPFMTLGCASGQEDHHYYSYLEFTFRDPEFARHLKSNSTIEHTWTSWLSERCQNHVAMGEAIKNHVTWEYREFSFREKSPQFLVTVYLKAQNIYDHAQLATWIGDFFKNNSLATKQPLSN